MRRFLLFERYDLGERGEGERGREGERGEKEQNLVRKEKEKE